MNEIESIIEWQKNNNWNTTDVKDDIWKDSLINDDLFMFRIWRKTNEYSGIFKIFRVIGNIIISLLYSFLNMCLWAFSIPIGIVFAVYIFTISHDSVELKKGLGRLLYAIFPIDFMNSCDDDCCYY